MLLRQLKADDGAYCAYLLGSVTSGDAVIIDPVPSVANAVTDALTRHGLRLVGVLETFVRRESLAAAESRFQNLIARLGVTQGRGAQGSARDLPWADLPRGGPVDPWAGGPADALTARALFSWQGSVRELSPLASQTFDPLRDTLSLQYRSARVTVAGLELSALPVGDRPDAVAYSCEGCLFSGAMLWSDPGAPGGPRTGDALLDLDSDTWVYPRRVDSVLRATLLEERNAWRHHHSPDRTVPPVDERGFLPVVSSKDDGAHDGLPAGVGQRTAAGYVDIEPAQLLLHLTRFQRLLLVEDAGHVRASIPGIEVMRHADVVRQASEWCENKPVLVASEMGDRSRATARALVHNGMRRVYHLVGGTNLWEACGLPTEAIVEQRRGA